MKRPYIGIVKFNEYCNFEFKLELLLSEKNVTKFLLEKDTGIDHKTIQNYCLGSLKRIDLKVISTICEYLKCDFDDIIEFKRNKE